ncbi:hypothetical protein GCM10025331_10970 [Actinoplanes utahensis]|uniref:Nucleotidyltransferase family protein n=1 Tax=Actinoplanes utahensis TaxID=1869 RepID=A0A0A6UAJ1_ACTUT|nr:hypothetical protein MB27_42370 [Actinoplanes utahensis]GIF28835.1 hypothetical protein Aut01nite_18210 [Actinoplanes utahensis]
MAQLAATPGRSARQWTDLPERCLELNWPEIGVLALQHRVEGLLCAALTEAGCADQVPASVLSMLRRQAARAEARYRTCHDALAELAGRAPNLVSELVFFKGAGIATRYESRAHRMLGDFDLIVAEDRADELRRHLLELGFWEKPGRNGPTYFRNTSDLPEAGVEPACFDVHVDAPPKYNRTEVTRGPLWLSSTEPSVLGGIACRRLPVEMEIVELISHSSEHALSWIHVCVDDDVRMIRHLDVELLCEQEQVDAGRVGKLAQELGLTGEFALGLAVHEALRGGLPPVLEPLRPLVEPVRDLVDVVALPDGRLETWPVPLAERAFRTDRGALALAMMPDGRRHRDQWFHWRQGLLEGSEDVAAIAHRAEERVRSVLAV